MERRLSQIHRRHSVGAIRSQWLGMAIRTSEAGAPLVERGRIVHSEQTETPTDWGLLDGVGRFSVTDAARPHPSTDYITFPTKLAGSLGPTCSSKPLTGFIQGPHLNCTPDSARHCLEQSSSLSPVARDPDLSERLKNTQHAWAPSVPPPVLEPQGVEAVRRLST